jgi:hypothetical protein
MTVFRTAPTAAPLLAACSRSQPGAAKDEAPPAGDTHVTVTVVAPGGGPAAGIPRVMEAAGGARWVAQTDSAGVASGVWPSPPDGMKVASPARGDTTVTLSREAPGGSVTFVMDTAAMLP